MSEVKGKLVCCDRCGREIFLKYLGKGDADGGYTTWDIFEKLPENWLYMTECGTLCYRCAGIFRSFIHNFMDGNSVAPSWELKNGDHRYSAYITLTDRSPEGEA